MKEQYIFKKRILLMAVLIAAGTAVNTGLNMLASVLPGSLFLDTAGTIIAGALGGYMPGILTGLFSNLIGSLTQNVTIYYSCLNIMIGVLAAYFARKRYFSRLPQLLIPVVVFAATGGVVGSVLTWCLNPEASGMAAFLEQVGSDTRIDLADKAICVAAAALILRFLPQRVHDIYNFDEWRTRLESHRAKSGKLSLKARVVIMLTSATVLVALAIAVISIGKYHESLIDQQSSFAQSIAKLAASYVDPEKVDEYLEEGEAAEGYLETEAQLQKIWDSHANIEYIYCYRILEDGCHVVFDLDTPDMEGGEPGDIVGFDGSFSAYIPALLAGERIPALVSNDTFGWLLTAYVPVYDAKGNCQCYMAADMSMPRLLANERVFVTQMIALFVSCYILILAVGIDILSRRLVRPVNAMAEAASAFAYDSEEARENTIERIRALDIHTGDEIENLYDALMKTAEDTAGYISQVQDKNESINNLQSGLIIVLADLVESRDKCTGDHVKNTAAYVGIIMKEMKREGIYAGELTDEFVENVIRSAPLHDIGKIHVPDAVLNKPGKLTDEEYALMKGHALTGGDIIADAMERLDSGQTGYLMEARNLAVAHHEKWDGSGYPYGLKGEEIPLSARIMAVADVFDALVARRSYKEGMPFDKAMSIITEGAGTHFDPNIVNAFVSAADEIKHVSEIKSAKSGDQPPS